MGAVIINALISSKEKPSLQASNQVVLIKPTAENPKVLAIVSWSTGRFFNTQNNIIQRSSDFLQIQMGDESLNEDMGPLSQTGSEAIEINDLASNLSPEITQIEDTLNRPRCSYG